MIRAERELVPERFRCVLSRFGVATVDLPVTKPKAMSYAKFYSSSRDAVIRLYDEASNVIH